MAFWLQAMVCIAWGDNLEQAKRHIEILEYLLEINALSTHLTSK